MKPSAKLHLGSNHRTQSFYDYLSTLAPQVAQSFTSQQLEAIAQFLSASQPSPKIVDLRFTVDLIISRFYLVILVGKDRRQKQRQAPTKLAKVGNLMAAIALLIGANLVLSAAFILLAYLIKSAVGINLFPNRHITKVLQDFFR